MTTTMKAGHALANGYQGLAEEAVKETWEAYPAFDALMDSDEARFNAICQIAERAALAAIARRFPVVIRPLDRPMAVEVGRIAATAEVSRLMA